MNIENIRPIRKKIEAHLWTKKYFIVFSRAKPGSEDMIVRNANMLSSRHAHIIKGEATLMAIIITITKIK